MDQNLIINILKKEVVPALGCTEPAAVALSAASAYKIIGGEIKKINVVVNSNIYKNGMSVGIPGIDRVGLNVAAALGAYGGDSKLGLEVLKNITPENAAKSISLIDDKKVCVSVDDAEKDFYINCEVETSNGKGTCVIRNCHTNIVLLQANDEVLFKNDVHSESAKCISCSLTDYKLIDIYNEIENISFDKLAFLLDGANMNLAMAEEGLANEHGMGIGRQIKSCIDKGILSDDMYHKVVMMTAAGSDARMEGYAMPVMSSAGSGNHGLTAIIPVAVASKILKASDDKLVRALAISHITTIYIKQFTGRLSGICGCGVAAATGASVALTYLLGGGEKEFEYAIRNMVGDVTGIICDGAKAGCAIKLSTAAGAALKSALLAVNGCAVPCDNGVVGYTMEDTVKNLGRVSAEGMRKTDNVILDIMVKKNCSSAV